MSQPSSHNNNNNYPPKPVSSSIEVDSETLQRYRQDVIQTITKWERDTHGSLSSSHQMTLANFASNRAPSGASYSSSSAQAPPRRCVVCAMVERFTDHASSRSNSPSSSSSAASLPPLDALLQDFNDHGWINYDGLDHCFSCARRLACEILAPHFAKSRRESSKKVLARIVEKENNISSNASNKSGGGMDGQRSISNENNANNNTNTTGSSSSSSPGRSWICASCGSSNEPAALQCSLCETQRAQPLLCPYCNLDAAEAEFCPNDPDTPLESYLTYEKNDPVLNFSWKAQNTIYNDNSNNNNNDSKSNSISTSGGRHDVWTCENPNCNKQNLGLVHHDFCRSCKKQRVWHCTSCKNAYTERTFCPKCGSRGRAGSHAEVEEIELCKLTGMTVQEARRQRQVSSVLDQARVRLLKRVEKQLGLVNVKAADDGNCLFRALSFQLFRTPNLHHLLRLLAVEHIIFEKDKFINFISFSTTNNNNNDSSSSMPPGLSSPEQAERRFYTYVKKLSRDGEWGDALVLHAISRIFNSQVHIVSAAQDQWHNIISPAIPSSSNGNETEGGDRSVISPLRSNNNNKNTEDAAEEDPSASFMTKIGLVFISFIAELHYNSIVLSREDSFDNVLPYRKWLSFGELSSANLVDVSTFDKEDDDRRNRLANNSSSNPFNVNSNNSISRTTSPSQLRSNSESNHNSHQQSSLSTRPPPPPGPPHQQNNNNNQNQSHLTKPILVKTSTVAINSPFDRVAAYFPSADNGAPLFWLNFHHQNGRMFLSNNEPQFFQRHIVSEMPLCTRQAYPRKMGQNFHLFDEVGKKLVTTMMPLPSGPGQPLAINNDAVMMNLELLQTHSEKNPRCSVVTSFRDGSCAIGPWSFVFEWRGPRVMVKLERPSSLSTSYKQPVRVEFVDEKLLHSCQYCRQWYVTRPNTNNSVAISSGGSHRCEAMIAATKVQRR